MGNSGGKGIGLEELIGDSKDYKVPGFEEIDVSYYDLIEKQLAFAKLASIFNAKSEGIARHFDIVKLPEEIEARIDEIAEKYKGMNVIVRSNSLREDSNLSFAGRYDSFVVEDATKEKLMEAVLKVYASIHSEKAQKYWEEHGITGDKMGIIIQEFIEPDFSGVMYTSNPTYPYDLTVEFTEGRFNVDENKENYIIDFDKKNMERVFESENYDRNYDQTRPFDVDKLARTGKRLEKKFGPSDIEFIIKEGKFYLVQKRKITDLEYTEEVEIPEYEESQFVGSTKITRGKGKVTLPAVKDRGIEEVSEGISMYPDKVHKQINGYFEYLKKMDERFSIGYILVLPHFNEQQASFGRNSSTIKYKTDTDSLTPHKKAVITTNISPKSSHIMTIARERGIKYAGFIDESIFKKIYTGDVLSIYFKGREALVYKERSEMEGKRALPSGIPISINEKEGGYPYYEIEWWGNYRKVDEDILLFLNSNTDMKWKFECHEEVMGGEFIDENGRGIMLRQIGCYGKSYEWSLHPTFEQPMFAKKSLPEKELKEIIRKYNKFISEI